MRTEETSTERLFWRLGAELMAKDPDVVEGTIMNGRCLRVGKSFLALVDYKGSGLVVKLTADRVAELITSGVGQPFAPAGRNFKEWVSVPKPDHRLWASLLREGVALAKHAVEPSQIAKRQRSSSRSRRSRR